MNISSVIYTGATNTRNPIHICIHTQPINYDGRPNLIPVYETNRQQPYDPTGEIQKALFSGFKKHSYPIHQVSYLIFRWIPYWIPP